MAMGSNHGYLGLVLLILPMLISSASAFFFNVGGKDGWVVKPSEDYSHWAQRNRFQVNDILHFGYKRGTDSVLVVTKENYDSCNREKPLHRFKGGGSTIKLNKSGTFYFISGNVENCKQGQKVTVVVMDSSHHQNPSSPPSIAPSTTTPPPSKSPSPSTPPSVAPAKSPSVSPATPSTDLNAPAPAPSKNSGSKSSFGVALGISFVVVLFFSSFV